MYENERLTPFEKNILDNFYWSFHHSQGNPSLQNQLIIYITRTYTRESIGNIEVLKAKLIPFIEKMAPPRQHKKTVFVQESLTSEALTAKTAFHASEGFSELWQRQLLMLQKIKDPNFKPQSSFIASTGLKDFISRMNTEENQLLVDILNSILKRDKKYQLEDRPGRDPGYDPHESFLRKYVVEQKPLQTEQYTRLYGDLDSLINALQIPGINYKEMFPLPQNVNNIIQEMGLTDDLIHTISINFQALRRLWERNHPGDQFWPKLTLT